MPKNQRVLKRTPMQSAPLLKPGFLGLNSEIASLDGQDDPAWAASLDNFVWDDLGRIAFRQGYDIISTGGDVGAADAQVHHLHEHVSLDSTSIFYGITDDYAVVQSTDVGVNWTEPSGAPTFTTLRAQFASFNDDLYLAVRGHKVHRLNAGSWAELTDSPVTDGLILSSFGRLWVPENGTSSIKYCQQLDGTDWTSAGAGSIDTGNAWTQATDNVTAITAFGASLIVFGKEHILIYVDGAGSELGVDPDNLYVVDTIEGTGTQNPDSVINIGEGDLWFLGPHGVQSLARVVQDKVNPLTELTNDQRSVIRFLADTYIVPSTVSCKAVYSAEQSAVLFLFPEGNRVLHFDMRFPLPNGSWRVSTWTTATPYYSALSSRAGNLYFGDDSGDFLQYAGYLDNATAITGTYATPWLSLAAFSQIKIIKSFWMRVYGLGTVSGTARWGKNFRPLEFSQAWTNTYDDSGAEWGSGEWGSAEFGDGLRMRDVHIAGSNQGEYIKFYTTITSNSDAKVALEEIGIRYKTGKVT